MVDSGNAKAKREFKKLSGNVGGGLDKEKGRFVPNPHRLIGPVHPLSLVSFRRSFEELWPQV